MNNRRRDERLRIKMIHRKAYANTHEWRVHVVRKNGNTRSKRAREQPWTERTRDTKGQNTKIVMSGVANSWRHKRKDSNTMFHSFELAVRKTHIDIDNYAPVPESKHMMISTRQQCFPSAQNHTRIAHTKFAMSPKSQKCNYISIIFMYICCVACANSSAEQLTF